MDYYQRRIRAFKLIDTMLEDNKPIGHIIFKVSTLYGFGAKIVNDRVKIIEGLKE